MSLSLTCTCGAKLEIDDKFAGTVITCPDCEKPINAGPPPIEAARTSGWALASFLLALIGPFTFAAPLLAVGCGGAALADIRRRPREVGGRRLALAGLLMGSLFSLLSVAAYLSPEVLGVDGIFREIQWCKKLQFPTNLPIVVGDGPKFTIAPTRRSWGKTLERLGNADVESDDLILVDPWNDAYIACMNEKYDRSGEDPETVLKRGMRRFLDSETVRSLQDVHDDDGPRSHQEREPKTLPSTEPGTEIYEMLIDLNLAKPPRTFVVRIVKMDGRKLCIVAGGTRRSRFTRMEPELRQIVASYQVEP